MGVGQITSLLLIFIGKLSDVTQKYFYSFAIQSNRRMKEKSLPFAFCLTSEIKNQHYNDN